MLASVLVGCSNRPEPCLGSPAIAIPMVDLQLVAVGRSFPRSKRMEAENR